MNIRPAVPADAPDVASVHVDSWRAAYVGLVPQDYLDGLSVESRTAMWQRALGGPGPAIHLVAVGEDQRICGFCVYGPSRDSDAQREWVGEIVAIYVQPDRWRQGAGHALCAEVISGARSSGWRDLTLWVLHGNERARRFYEVLGFRADGAEKRSSQLTGRELHEVRYRLHLDWQG